MKNYYFFAAMIICSTFLISCNWSKEDKSKDDKKPDVDSTKSTTISPHSNWPKNDSIRKIFSTYSLNKLLKIYNENVKLESPASLNLAELAYDEIEDLHKIDSVTYNKFVDDFWKPETPVTKVLNKNDLIAMIGTAKVTDYIEFTFTEDKNNFFNYKVVSNHNFKTKLSCIPAIIFLKMKNDTIFEKLEIVKGVKTFTSPSKYSGPHLMAILKYKDSKNKIQYFDIVDDPTIDRNGYDN